MVRARQQGEPSEEDEEEGCQVREPECVLLLQVLELDAPGSDDEPGRSHPACRPRLRRVPQDLRPRVLCSPTFHIILI